MILLLIVIVLLSLGLAGISVKLWLKKNGKFSGTCASQHILGGQNQHSCGLCGKKADECERLPNLEV